jgi:hypothetical protein
MMLLMQFVLRNMKKWKNNNKTIIFILKLWTNKRENYFDSDDNNLIKYIKQVTSYTLDKCKL